jgi:hypothetical protein
MLPLSAAELTIVKSPVYRHAAGGSLGLRSWRDNLPARFPAPRSGVGFRPYWSGEPPPKAYGGLRTRANHAAAAPTEGRFWSCAAAACKSYLGAIRGSVVFPLTIVSTMLLESASGVEGRRNRRKCARPRRMFASPIEQPLNPLLFSIALYSKKCHEASASNRVAAKLIQKLMYHAC